MRVYGPENGGGRHHRRGNRRQNNRYRRARPDWRPGGESAGGHSGARLVAYDPYIQPARATQLGVTLLSLEELLAESDFITIHLPKTPETANLIGAAELAKTKRGARIINARAVAWSMRMRSPPHCARARFPVQGGRIQRRAAVDNALVGLPGVVATPHLGASTAEAK